MTDLFAYLQSKPYPGRGIALGQSLDGNRAVMVYFIMGRSENSRNRIFVETEDGIETRAFDESKMADPSLIIYHPVRVMPNRITIVTNGDQTDTIRDNILAGHCYRHALNTRTFEPDGPNWTPRISGVVKPNGSYDLSILKSADGDPACCCRYFYEYEKAIPGLGHFISTYVGDGDPIPSFRGEPIAVTFGDETAQELADKVWAALNEDNKVSLFVRTVDLKSGETHTAIINKHQEG